MTADRHGNVLAAPRRTRDANGQSIRYELLPAVSIVAPNERHYAHKSSLAAADAWLQQHDASQREVGVDIETVPCDADIDGMARIAFSPAERAALAALAAPARRDAFCRIWSRKEAFVKARGAGLTYPTQSFSVSHHATDDDALLTDDREAEAVHDWRLRDIPAPHGYYAAPAGSGRDWSARSIRITTAMPESTESSSSQ